jgi:hypothetical protein
MDHEKQLARESVTVLIDKAQDCLAVAQDQHKIADKQHKIADSQNEIADRQGDNADMLDSVGNALMGKAVDLHGELDINAPHIRLRERADGAPPKAESLPKKDI